MRQFLAMHLLSPNCLILIDVHYMFATYHYVGNASAGYLLIQHTLSQANSV